MSAKQALERLASFALVKRAVEEPEVEDASLIGERLYLGRADQAANSKLIRRLGITHVVNVTSEYLNIWNAVEVQEMFRALLGDEAFARLDSGKQIEAYECQTNFAFLFGHSDRDLGFKQACELYLSYLTMYSETPVIHYHRVPVRDRPYVQMEQHFNAAIEFIAEALRNETSTVLIHCQQGISRSATIAAAYFMINERVSVEIALTRVKEGHSKANPNPGFLKQLKKLEKRVFC